jgi:hypothetical protein
VLRKRLKELLHKNNSILKDYIAHKKDFITKVVDTRNYYTHYTPELCRRAAKEKELYQITEKLKMIIEVCFLGELGLTPAEIRGLISAQYRHLRS